jgi:hypothetical protein
VAHEELGRGAFGRAIRAERRSDGALVCIKVLQSGSMSKQERAMVSNCPSLNVFYYEYSFYNTFLYK